MPYRCQGCRVYQRGSPYRRVGLGGVCSDDCVRLAGARRRHPSQPANPLPAATHTAVLERDGGCRYCGTHVGLHVHHINYRSQGVDHSETNLITLCYHHHDLVHSDKRYWQPVLRAYISTLYDTGRKLYLREIDRQMDRS